MEEKYCFSQACMILVQSVLMPMHVLEIAVGEAVAIIFIMHSRKGFKGLSVTRGALETQPTTSVQ